MPRKDERANDQLRELSFTMNFQVNPAGSVLMGFGETRVICSVSDTPGVPRWKREQGVPGGWLTAEYQMLPGATQRRAMRESSRGRPAGRSSEIQRLIGRSLRAAVDLEKIGERTLHVDCDVLDADGGTRCAAITGAAVALELALLKLFGLGKLTEWPLIERLAAVSVGIVDGVPMLDLDYTEDSAADVDMNVVMTGSGKFVEIQGTAESEPFPQEDLDAMLVLARTGLATISARQKEILKAAAEQH